MSDQALQHCESIAARALVLIRKMQEEVASYLPPDSGISEHEILNELIELIDGPEWRQLETFIRNRHSLHDTLQRIYDAETNVRIETCWDAGWELFLGGDPISDEWPETGKVFRAMDIEPWLRERSEKYQEAYQAAVAEHSLTQ